MDNTRTIKTFRHGNKNKRRTTKQYTDKEASHFTQKTPQDRHGNIYIQTSVLEENFKTVAITIHNDYNYTDIKTK